jgi:hypothetical protein
MCGNPFVAVVGASRQSIQRTGLIVKVFRNKELAMVFAPFSRNSSFWRPADACSFASNLLLSGYQRATDNNGTPQCCHRSISIVADGRLDVCDGAHWAFVMKKSQRPPPSLRDRTCHPPGARH